MQRRDHRRGAMTCEEEAERLDVRVDDVEALVLAPHHAQGHVDERRDVAAVVLAPQAPRYRRHELDRDLRVARRKQRHAVTATMQLLGECPDHAFRAGIRGWRDREHRRRDEGDSETVGGGHAPIKRDNEPTRDWQRLRPALQERQGAPAKVPQTNGATSRAKVSAASTTCRGSVFPKFSASSVTPASANARTCSATAAGVPRIA